MLVAVQCSFKTKTTEKKTRRNKNEVKIQSIVLSVQCAVRVIHFAEEIDMKLLNAFKKKTRRKHTDRERKKKVAVHCIE